MFIKLLRWLKGYVYFEIKGRFPERFINICLKYGMFVFNAGPKGNGFFGSLMLSDYRNIRMLARKSRVTLKVKEKHGLPFLFKKYRHRKGLLAGAVFFMIIVFIMQGFVWTVDINGLDSVSEVYVRELLREYGMYEGTFKAGLNFHSVERKLMEEIEDISWMSINIIGTKAEVEIREKAPVPQITDFFTPCNVKAERDALIIDMNVKSGSTNLTKGSAVAKGQLLISGIVKNSLDELSYVHADGTVLAQTVHSLTIEAEKTGVYMKPVSTVKRYNLQFFWFNIPLSLSSLKGEYTTRVISQKLCLNDTCVEFGKRTEYCTLYEKTEFTLNDDAAEELLNTEDFLYRLFTLKECESINAEKTTTAQKEKYVSYVKYSCTENIAYKENIIVN